MESESARMSSAAEARFRIDYPNSKPRAVKVVALDAASERVVKEVAQRTWQGASFFTSLKFDSPRSGEGWSMEAWLSDLAGRTKAPPTQAAPVRIGGFGGAQGLADYLTTQHVDMLIDATHPYAANISGNAAEAAAIARVPLLALRRPPWAPRPGDNWTDVADPVAAVQALGQSPRRVFLALGRNEIGCFTLAPQHYYLVRSVDQVDPPLAVPRAAYVTGRGPFTEADDRGLLSAHAIDIVVARNSGGTATYGKIAAARALGLAGYGLAPGCHADLVVLDARDAAQAITEQAEKLYVIKGGRVVARTTRTTELSIDRRG